MKKRITTIAAGWLLAIGIISQTGCATVATHYQTRAAMEREARINVARGLGPLCTVEGEATLINDVTFWSMVRDNWPDYLKAAGLDFGICLAAYLIYREARGDDHVGDVYQKIYYPSDSGEGDGEGDDDGGGEDGGDGGGSE